MITKMRSAIVFATSMLLSVAESHAVQDLANGWTPSPLEIAQTPDYCQKQFRSPSDPSVVTKNSPGCDGVHHYCAGLVLLVRVRNTAIPKQERRRILGRAKQEIDYVGTRNNTSCLKVRMKEIEVTKKQVPIMENFVR